MGILWAHIGAIGCIVLTLYTLWCTYELENTHKLMGFYMEDLILGIVL